MKTHPISVCLALAAIIALIVAACAINQKHGPGVSIHETYVEIYPGTKISSADQKALDAVLNKFSKSFYKIRTYEHGKLVKTQGSLEETRIDQILVAEAKKASLKGVSESTQQIGIAIQTGTTFKTAFMVYVNRPSSPPPAPAWTKPSAIDLQISKRLVSRVRPILQKYSHQLALQSERTGN